MRSKLIYGILLSLLLGTKLCAQTDTLFWFVAPYNSTGHCAGATCPGGQPVLFRISTMDLASTVTISQPANPAFIPIILNVPANATVSYDITARLNMLENVPADNINNFGIQIHSTNLITVYYEVNQWYNPEIYALKGKNALGLIFYISSQNTWDNGNYTPQPYSSFEIVATEDNTNVTITVSNAIIGHAAGSTFTITLNKGQTYSAKASSQAAVNHLQGSKVVSGKPIAITISDDSVAKDGCRDLIGDQTVPVAICGLEYIIMKGQIFTDERFFVLATEDNTEIFIDGISTTTINEAQTYSYVITQATHVRATHPVYMYHVAGFQCELGSAILPPIDQCTGSTQVGFTRSIDQDFYMNIMVRTGAEDGFILNGDGPNTIIPATAFQNVPGTTDWKAAVFNFTAGATVPTGAASLLSNTKDMFHIGIINGSSSVGCRYGYFSDFNVMQINAIVAGTGSDVIKRCYGESAQLVATGGAQYIWSPTINMDNPNIATPIVTPLTTTKYTVTVSGACNMTDSASITVFVAPPMNVSFSIENTAGCTPFTANILNTSTGVTDYNWYFGNGDSSDFSGNNFSYTYNNYTTNPVIYTLDLIGNNIYDCKDTVTRQITVYPDVQAVFSASPVTGCHPLTVAYTNNSVAADYYEWNYGDGGSSSQDQPDHTFYNWGNNDTTYTTSLLAFSQYGCSDTSSLPVLVAPYLRADFTAEYVSGCSPFHAEIINASIGASVYEWDFGDGFTSDLPDATLEHIFTNTSGIPEIFNIRLVVKNSYNCTDTLIRQITVFPPVNADFTATPIIGCNPLNVAFTNLSTSATIYDWQYGEGGTSSFEDTFHIYENLSPNDTTFNTLLIAISQYNCRDTASMPVTVFSYLNANFSMENVTGCSPYNAEITNASIGAVSYLWNYGDGTSSDTSATSFTHIYTNLNANPAVNIIELIAYNNHNCTDTLSIPITINPQVIAQANASIDNGCSPLEVSFLNTSLGAVNYFWNFADGSSSSIESPDHTFLNYNLTDTIYYVQLVAISQFLCYDTLEIPITVSGLVKADFSIEYSQGCTPFNAVITNNSIGATSNSWNFGDGISYEDNNANLTYQYENNTNNPLNYNITLAVQGANACTDTMQRTITIYPGINADFTAQPIQGCNPLSVEFTNTSTGASNYQWNFGDSGNSANENPIHEYQNYSLNDTIFNAQLIAISQFNCTDTAITTITVYPYLKADFAIQSASGCTPFNLQLINNSIGANSYQWNFGDGTISDTAALSFSHSYINTSVNPVDYVMELIVTNSNNCTDTIRKTITVNPSVVASFTPDITIGCNPLEVTFTNNSTGATAYDWIYGDGSSSAFPSGIHSFVNFSNNDTTYHVSLIAISPYNCTDTITSEITVYSYLLANFALENYSGCAPFDAVITNNSIGAITYDWAFGDGMTSQSGNTVINYTYNNNGSTPLIRTIELAVTNSHGCADTIQKDITVFPPVTAYFTASPINGCNPLSVQFTNFSSNAENYTWNYGDGGSSELPNPEHLFTNLSTQDTVFNTTLIATSQYNCNDTFSQNITVYGKLFANFTFEYNSGCSPFVAEIINSSEGATQYYWTMGDGTFSDTPVQNFSYSYTNNTSVPDTNTINLDVWNSHGCMESLSRDVIIFPGVHAAFTNSPENGCSPLNVNFQNTSVGSQNLVWEFGDGGSSIQQNPEHLYYNFSSMNDSVEAVLIVNSVYGCNDTARNTIIVHPQVTANFIIENYTGCAPYNAQILNISGNAEFCFWNFGDGDTMTSNDSVVYHTFSNSGNTPLNYYITLIAGSSTGCTDTIIRQITVYPQITSAFASEPLQGCSPLAVNFTNQSEGAANYLWNFGDGIISQAENPTHVFINESNEDILYSVSLLSYSLYNCIDSSKINVNVSPAPVALFTTDTTESCTPFTLAIQNLSSGGDSYIWNFGDGDSLVSDSANISHLYVNNSSQMQAYQLVLNAVTVEGCTAQFSKTVFVFPNLVANFTINNAECSPYEAGIINTSEGATSAQWNFGDGTNSLVYHPNHTFTNTTYQDVNYDVTLIAQSTYGCSDTITKKITVYPSPDASFFATPTEQTYPSSTVSIVNTTQGTWYYSWSFGDGQTAQGPAPGVHIYNTWGEYTITLVASGEHCIDSISQTIKIIPVTPVSQFTSSALHGCPPLVVNFTNQSLYSNSFYWEFGDGSVSTQENPEHTFYTPGTYEVELTATGFSGQSNSFQTIVVHQPPNAFFHINPAIVTIPDEQIQCYNLSDNGANYLWHFGDGDTSTLENPSHSYINAGMFDITLIAYSAEACTDTFTLSNGVRARSECNVIFPNAFTPNTGGGNGGAYTLPDLSFDVFHPLFRSVSSYKLEIFNRWGELLFVSDDIMMGWDGYYKNDICKQDVYVWKASWICADGKEYEAAGDVTVLR